VHQALFLSEILDEMFSHLNPILQRRPWSWLSLAVLTRTCKTFHDPTMDLLWANLEGLEPLLGCVARLRSVGDGADAKVSVD
jgi:hypothetical protein